MPEGCTELLQFVLVSFPLHEYGLCSLSSSIGVVSTHGDTPIEKHATFVAQMCLFPAQRAKQSSSLFQWLRIPFNLIKSLQPYKFNSHLTHKRLNALKNTKFMHSVRRAFGGATVFPLVG